MASVCVQQRAQTIIPNTPPLPPLTLLPRSSGIIPAVEYLKSAAALGAVTLLDKAPGGVRVDEFLKAGLDIYAAGTSRVVRCVCAGCPVKRTSFVPEARS